MYEDEANSTLVILFIPSKEKDGKDRNDQELWVDAAATLLSDLFGGATIMPPAQGAWLNPETGQLIREAVVLVHCYVRGSQIDDPERLKALARFLHRMGAETNQGEVGIVIGDVFHRIRRFTQEGEAGT